MCLVEPQLVYLPAVGLGAIHAVIMLAPLANMHITLVEARFVDEVLHACRGQLSTPVSRDHWARLGPHNIDKCCE